MLIYLFYLGIDLHLNPIYIELMDIEEEQFF